MVPTITHCTPSKEMLTVRWGGAWAGFRRPGMVAKMCVSLNTTADVRMEPGWEWV